MPVGVDSGRIEEALIELTDGPEPGHCLVGEDEHGAHWGISVEGLRFRQDSTEYLFTVGAPIQPAAAAAAAAVETLGIHRYPAQGTTGHFAIELHVLADSIRLGVSA